MNSSLFSRVGRVSMAVFASTVLSACGSIGDTGAVKQANELAIACQTDQALIAVDRAARGGGLGANIADLQRVVILRDAGRTSEAAAAMAERNARVGADAEAAAEAERAVSQSLADLRAERRKRTGRGTCP
jgi:hypothetical protein